MLTFFAIIGVILVITFRNEFRGIFDKVTPKLKDTAENVSSSVKTFVEEKKAERTKKTLLGKYVVEPVEIVEIRYLHHGQLYNSLKDFKGSYCRVFTFSNGSKFSLAYYSQSWSILEVGNTCSHVKKYNRRGQLTFEQFLPVPPENVCYRAFGRPYYRNYHSY